MVGTTASPQPAGGPSDLSPQAVSAHSGAHRAYGEIQRLIRQNWQRVRAYRALTAMERRIGDDNAARKWAAYRASALNDIRMLREHVR